jgi:predicted transcriptional regulator
MTKRKPPTPIYVRPTPELRERLDARAKAERRTVRAIVEAALAVYLQTPVSR